MLFRYNQVGNWVCEPLSGVFRPLSGVFLALLTPFRGIFWKSADLCQNTSQKAHTK